ncbi:MAG: ABC transporter substrate-binding protein [Clostridia bacterium]|nr:ABC transporter substrate-binding protein [Clostridia bacterium]MCI9413442.1 ABC transporter substrate-binding protein [Clostridia bacterium]
MKNLKKYLITILVIVVVAAVMTTCILLNKKEDTAQLKTIRVNEVTRSVFYAPQYVAIKNGYFAEEGLDIELTTGQGADKVMTAVLSGQSDIGFAGPEASIYVYNEGKEDHTQVFAQMTQKDGSFLVSKEKTDKFSWQDLKGKTVIPGRKGGVPYMTFEYVLKKNGLNPQKDLVLDDSIKFDLMAGAFAGGDAEYVTLFEPTASMTEAAGKGYVVASVGEASGEIPYTAYFAKKSYMEQNSDVIQGFTNAIYKGEKWVKEHTSQEIVEAIKEFFPDTDVKMLEAAVQSYMDIDAWKSDPILKKESFDLLQTVMKEAGELEKEGDYDKIVNNSYAEKAIKEVK